MSFLLICVGSIVLLGILAALFSIGGKDEPIVQGKDCSTCSSLSDGSCKIACLMEKQRAGEQSGMEKKEPSDNKETSPSVK